MMQAIQWGLAAACLRVAGALPGGRVSIRSLYGLYKVTEGIAFVKENDLNDRVIRRVWQYSKKYNAGQYFEMNFIILYR
jgi:hypothetical protein